jgi:hypothetical protein
MTEIIRLCEQVMTVLDASTLDFELIATAGYKMTGLNFLESVAFLLTLAQRFPKCADLVSTDRPAARVARWLRCFHVDHGFSAGQ